MKTLKASLAIIAITFILGACNPETYYDECQARGNHNDAMCGFMAMGSMFVHPSW